MVRQRGLVARSSRGSPGSSKSTAAMGDVDVLKLCDVVPPPAPPCTIGSLRVAGCKGMGSWEVQQLQAAVGHLDVSLCRCGRVGVLQRCGATSPEAGPEARAAGRMASSLGSSPRAPEAGTIGGTASPSSSSPGSASPSSASGSLSPTHWGTAGTPQEGASTPAPRCPGLCSACSELFKGCGSNVCGACWEPRVAHQVSTLVCSTVAAIACSPAGACSYPESVRLIRGLWPEPAAEYWLLLLWTIVHMRSCCFPAGAGCEDAGPAHSHAPVGGKAGVCVSPEKPLDGHPAWSGDHDGSASARMRASFRLQPVAVKTHRLA